MKAKVTKLELFENEQITLIAPEEMINNFLIELSNMAHFAAKHAEKMDYYNMQEFYERFSKETEILTMKD